MSNQATALATFQAARRCYEQRQFGQACALINEYHSSINYLQFPREDRRPPSESGEPVMWSAIVVTHNPGPDLFACLDAIFGTAYPSLEVIVVDNSANLNQKAELTDYPVCHICPPGNLLPSEARNVGAFFSSAKNLAFIDDDGLVCRAYFDQASRLFSDNAIVGARGRIIPRTTRGPASPHYDMGDKVVSARLNLEGNMVIRRQLFESLGGFDSLMFGHEGLELTERCINRYGAGSIVYDPELVLQHDFAHSSRLEAKNKRQALGVAYREHLENQKKLQESLKVNEEGVSIVLVAHDNLDETVHFVEHFVKGNTYSPAEVLILAGERASEFVARLSAYVGQAKVTVLPVATQMFPRLASKLRFQNTLIVKPAFTIAGDFLPKLIKSGNLTSSAYVNLEPYGLPSGIATKRSALQSLPETSINEVFASRTISVLAGTSIQDIEVGEATRAVDLDLQISELQEKLEALDKSLDAKYSEIERLDQLYDQLDEGTQEATDLREKLKTLVGQSNDMLIQLKDDFDRLEHLRIKKYSVKVAS